MDFDEKLSFLLKNHIFQTLITFAWLVAVRVNYAESVPYDRCLETIETDFSVSILFFRKIFSVSPCGAKTRKIFKSAPSLRPTIAFWWKIAIFGVPGALGGGLGAILAPRGRWNEKSSQKDIRWAPPGWPKWRPKSVKIDPMTIYLLFRALFHTFGSDRVGPAFRSCFFMDFHQFLLPGGR